MNRHVGRSSVSAGTVIWCEGDQSPCRSVALSQACILAHSKQRLDSLLLTLFGAVTVESFDPFMLLCLFASAALFLIAPDRLLCLHIVIPRRTRTEGSPK